MIHPTLPLAWRVRAWRWTYRDSRGAVWIVDNVCPPVPWRTEDWDAVRADDEGERVCAAGPTMDACLAAVEEWIADDE